MGNTPTKPICKGKDHSNIRRIYLKFMRDFRNHILAVEVSYNNAISNADLPTSGISLKTNFTGKLVQIMENRVTEYNEFVKKFNTESQGANRAALKTTVGNYLKSIIAQYEKLFKSP